MAQQSWCNLLNAGAPWQTTQGTQLATAATATISPQATGPADFIMPIQPNGLQWYPGMGLRIKARGTLASGATTSTLTVFLACGVSGTLATTLTTTGGIVLGTGAVTPLNWKLDANVVCTAIGTSGNTLEAEGELIFQNATAIALTGGANAVFCPMPYTAVAYNTFAYPGVASTAATAMGLRATLSAAFGNIQCNRFMIEQLS